MKRRQILGYTALGVIILVGLIYPKQLVGFGHSLVGILLPLILGAALAYILDLLCSRIEKWYFPRSQRKIVVKTRRVVSLLLTFLIVILVIALILRLVLPQFGKALSEFFAAMPLIAQHFVKWVQQTDQLPLIQKQLSSVTLDWSSIESKVMKYFTSGLGGILGSTVTVFSTVAKGAFDGVLALIFAIYMLSSKEKLLRNIKRVGKAFIKPSWQRPLHHVLSTTHQVFSSFIVGQVTEAVILGTLCMIGMWLFRFPYAVSIGAFVGMMALIPIFGAWIGAAVGCLLIGVNDPVKALLFIVFILALQQLEGHLIYPKVVGTSIGLPGLWVLAAITVGSGLGGFLGILLGVPVVATGYRLLSQATTAKLKS
ncbi:AI-2E family transporter [Loigolactobacillus bifermentans]|uniref:AI-2E family transporter n=1 Tax=Loigolactobacillus bifermentans TaxID=1607 RepID=UPI000709C629|nr:AI-2E family transporter [Loigolactobacillus bifermentans]